MKNNFQCGETTIEAFFAFINERHAIWCRRASGLPKPWTEDPVFLDWKFTNVFRELDTGTIALRRYLTEFRFTEEETFFVIVWYRLFNLADHLEDGRLGDYQSLEKYLRGKSGKIFTSAHMTTGVFAEDKIDTYLRAAKQAWGRRQYYVKSIAGASMEAAFRALKELYMVGPFVAYEIVCDLRFTTLIDPSDRMTWANVGPGAARGLRRLGLPATLGSMVMLLEEAPKHLGPHFKKHLAGVYPPFELREIEHSLCEFDKYRRVINGGRPRQKYSGRA